VNLWKVYHNDKPADPVIAADVHDALDWAETCADPVAPMFVSVVCEATDIVGMREIFPRTPE